jgi:hypothetical protein
VVLRARPVDESIEGGDRLVQVPRVAADLPRQEVRLDA